MANHAREETSGRIYREGAVLKKVGVREREIGLHVGNKCGCIMACGLK